MVCGVQATGGNGAEGTDFPQDITTRQTSLSEGGADFSQDIAPCQRSLSNSGCEGQGHRAASFRPFTCWTDQEGNRLHPVAVWLKLCEKGYSVNIFVSVFIKGYFLKCKLWHFSFQMKQPAEPAPQVCHVYIICFTLNI